MQHSIFQDEDSAIQDSNSPDYSYLDNPKDSCMGEEIRKHTKYKDCIDDQKLEPDGKISSAGSSWGDNFCLPLFCDDSYQVLRWFQQKKLIKSELRCESCSHLMIWTAQQKLVDGYDWRCRNNKCAKFAIGKTIRQKSFFAKSKLSLPKWFDIMYMWSKHVGVTEASEQVSISRVTISNCYGFFREVCEVYFKSNPIKLGGSRVTLDVDVFSLTHKRKSKGGPANSIFCIVDSNCSPSIGYMETVERMDVTTLFPIIMKVVEPGSVVHTKDWREYCEIQAYSDRDEMVNHSIHFVDIDDRLHKDNIESYRNNHKSVITAMSGCKRNLLNSYLQEFMWRERFSGNALDSLCQHIVVQFSDGKYNNSTNDSFFKKKTENQKQLEITTEAKDITDYIKVELEENINYFEDPPSEKSCLEVGQEMQISNDALGYTDEKEAEHEIVNTSDEILEDDDLYRILFCNDSSKVLQWFQQRKLIKSELRCESCSHLMIWTAQQKLVDGYDWRCRNNKCEKFAIGKTIRQKSFFAKSKLSLPKWFDIMYMWSKYIGVTEASEQVNISRVTISNCYGFFREVCEVYFKSNPIKLGGPRVTLDVDVFSLTHKRKSKGGPAISIFCIVDSNCSPSIGYMEIVEKMDVTTLFPIIMRVVEPGSVVQSKDWREYSEIQVFSNKDRNVNPSINFVDVDEILHKKIIGSYRNNHKSVITAMSGCKRNLLNSYLQEFMWRERFCDNTLECLCQHIDVQFSDATYNVRTDDSFLREEAENRKHLEIYSELENKCNYLEVELEENLNNFDESPSKKICCGVGQEVQSSNDAIGYTGNVGSESEIENPSDYIPVDDNSSQSLFFKDSSNVLQWFQQKKLIKSEFKCERCSHLMIWTAQPKLVDGYDWRCRNNKCVKFGICKTIRQGSFFAKSKLSLPKWFDIMYLWSKHVRSNSAVEQLNISRVTISNCYSFFKEVCGVYVKSNPIKLGGPRISLDIDVFCLIQETKRPKVPAVWIFCIVDSNSSPSIGYMEIIEKMDVANLFPIIMKVVEPGSVVHTKDWREYCEIQAYSGPDSIMDPSIHFEDVNDSLHKNYIESYCNNHKSVIITMRHCKRNLVNSYLQEFMWRERFHENTLESLCQHILVQFSDATYNANTNHSFHREETGNNKYLEMNTETENNGNCLEAELEENTNYLEESIPKKSFIGVGQDIKSNIDTIGYTDKGRQEQEIENSSEYIPLNDDPSYSLYFKDSSNVLQWFQQKKLIKSELKCESCSHLMIWTVQTKLVDGYDWRCRNNKCVKFAIGKTIRQGSFFAKSKLSLPKWFDIMYLWSEHVRSKLTVEQLNISRVTIANCYSFFKEVCEVYIKSNPIKLGGPRISLDIDVFCLIKETKRWKVPAVWVFCIVDSNCSPSIGYMEIVEKMDVTTLFPIIMKVVEPGSVIHTKDWREYCEIQAFSDRDGIMNHSINFVDVDERLNKKNIESYCNHHKSAITDMSHCRRNLVNSYLQEFMWRERFYDNTLESLCQHIVAYFTDVSVNDEKDGSYIGEEMEKEENYLEGKSGEIINFSEEPTPNKFQAGAQQECHSIFQDNLSQNSSTLDDSHIKKTDCPISEDEIENHIKCLEVQLDERKYEEELLS